VVRRAITVVSAQAEAPKVAAIDPATLASIASLKARDPAFDPAEEPSVRSARQRSLGVHFALDHAQRLPVVAAARLGRSLDVYALEDTIFQDVGEGRPKFFSWLGVVLFWGMAVVSVFGARMLDRRRRVLLLISVATVLTTSVLFYGAHRIRSSAEPSLVILTAVALVQWSRPVKRAEPS
jgi:hypothetical protein